MRVVFDAGPLINLSNACLLGILDVIKAEYYITPAVYREVYAYPRSKKVHAWSATLIGEYLGKKVKVRGLSARETSLVDELDRLLNRAYYTARGPVRILQRGELEAVVLSASLDRVVVIDERTMRLIIEDPEQLRQRLSRKLHSWVKIDEGALERARELIRDVFVVRSADLVAYAYEKGYFASFKDPVEALRSSLYALKHGGCAVSEEEIEAFVRGA